MFVISHLMLEVLENVDPGVFAPCYSKKISLVVPNYFSVSKPYSLLLNFAQDN